MDKKEDKRVKLLNAAANAFYKNGYSATSVDDIIKQVGGSKRTIYNEFGNKEGIFKSLVEFSINEVIKKVEKNDYKSGTLKENLTKFAYSLMNSYMESKTIGLFKVILNESNRFPEIGKFFYENGPKRSVLILSEILKNEEELKIDAYTLADHFIGMLRNNFHLSVLLGVRKIPTKEELTKHVELTIEIFLNGIYEKKSNA